MQIISDTNEKFVYTSNEVTTTIEKIGGEVFIRKCGNDFESYNKQPSDITFENLVTYVKNGGMISIFTGETRFHMVDYLVRMVDHLDERVNYPPIRGLKPRQYKD